MISLLSRLADLLHKPIFSLYTITILLSTAIGTSTSWAQVGCDGFDGTGIHTGAISNSNNGQLCLNKASSPAEMKIDINNVADGDNPDNFAVEIEWDDGSPRQRIEYNSGLITNTGPHSYEIPSVKHAFLPRPCSARPGAECSYRPKVFLRIGGVTCPGEFATAAYVRFNTDDQCSGNLAFTETISDSNVFLVSPGASVTFTDRTTLNCLPPGEILGTNFSKRWRQFVYGTTNTITGTVLVNGATVLFPFTPAGMPEISPDHLTLSSPPFPNNNTLSVTIPATAKAGEEFHIRMDYWNYCNQFGIDPPVQNVGIIRVAGLTAQSISFAALAAATYGDNPLTLNATASSGLTVTYSSSNTNVATISGNMVTVVGAGTTTITANQPGNNVYDAATAVPQNLTINKAALTVRADDKSRTYGDPNPGFTVSYSGFKKTDTQSVIDTAPTASTTAIQSSTVGVYNIVPLGALDNNYSFNYVNGTLTVSKAAVTATASNATREYGVTNPTLSIAYAGFKNGESASVLNTKPIASTAATVTSPVGIYPITVTGGTDNNYSLTYVSGTLTVTKATQSITFALLSDLLETAGSFTVVATASSGLPVTFNTTSTSRISISGNIVTIVSPGSITITASQAGNAQYQAAPPVSQTICITPKKPTIAVSGLDSNTPVLTSSSNTGNNWYRNGSVIADATEPSFTATHEGSYQVKVTSDGCSSEFSNEVSIIITAVPSLLPELQLMVYPNPTQDKIIVFLEGTSPDDSYELTIYDPFGAVVEKFTISGGERQLIPIDHYPLGNYFLRVVEHERTLIGRFIKK